MIGPLYNLDLKDIVWVIAGGESGLSPRPLNMQNGSDSAWDEDVKQVNKMPSKLYDKVSPLKAEVVFYLPELRIISK